MKVQLKRGTLAIVLALFTIPAFADAVFTLGNNPQPNEQNILFKTDQSGSPVFGFTNHTDTMVQFSSTTDTLVVTSGGQAKVTAADGLVNDITFSVPGHTFLDFILNPIDPAVANDLMVMVTMGDGSTFTYGPYGSLHGNNFLTITTTNGEVIASVTIDSKGGFGDLQEPRVSGISTAAVPEPASLVLLGSGMLGLMAMLRRKRVS
jgi:PEP-CTERM motif-containing protein